MRTVNSAPCIECEKKGCGAYHDECEKYKEYVEKNIQKSRSRIKSRAPYAKTGTRVKVPAKVLTSKRRRSE